MASLVFDTSTLLGWLAWTLYPISHRSPWGLWTSKQRDWYNAGRANGYGGMAPWAHGLKDLLLLPWVAVVSTLYTLSFQGDNSDAVYIATVVLNVCAIGMSKMSFRTLFWDYRDFMASFFTLVCIQLPLHVAQVVGVSLVNTGGQEWIRVLVLVTLGLLLVDTLQQAWTAWRWWHRSPDSAVSRKEQRGRMDIEKPLLLFGLKQK